MNEKELREGLDYVRACLRDIHARAEGRALAEDEQRSWDEGMTYVRETERTLARYDEIRALGDSKRTREGGPTFIPGREDRDTPEAVLAEYRSLSPREARQRLSDALLRANEDKIEGTANQAHFEGLVKRHRSDLDWAAGVLGRSREIYADAFSKCMTGRDTFLTDEERTALQVGSNANGGYLLPTHLDPTVILTNSGTSNVIRGMSRVVTLTEGETWNGVTSAGSTFSWDGELTEVSDDSPTFGRVSVTTYKAQGFAQASIEAFEDISGLANDVMMIFADARDRLEGAAHATGSGSQPQGIFTTISGSQRIDTITPQTIAVADLHAIYRAVPVRWRGNGTWLMNPLFSLAIKALGTAVSASYSGDLREPTAGRILGRPVVESDDAPSTAMATTTDEDVLIYGDFRNYLIVDKPGSMSVEFIPHLFNTANNLPDGRRGWYTQWRTGADSINDSAFRKLSDVG